MEDPKKKIIKIDVSGKDQALFNKLRKRLLESVERLLDSPINYQTGTTVREETKKLTSLALNYAAEKLKKPAIENQLLLAEIEEKYSIAEKNKAETRKIDAETNKLVFEQSLKELYFSIKLSKALIIGKKGEEAIIMLKELDSFLEAIEEIKSSQNIQKQLE